MPINKTWLRVDVERHFEGIPRTKIRDLVSVAKPKSNPKTHDVLRKVTNIPQMFGHTHEQGH